MEENIWNMFKENEKIIPIRNLNNHEYSEQNLKKR
jgi:hypothetical protein